MNSVRESTSLLNQDVSTSKSLPTPNPTDVKVQAAAKSVFEIWESRLAVVSEPVAKIAEPIVLLSDGGGFVRNLIIIAGAAAAIISPIGIIGGIATTYAGLNLILKGSRSFLHDLATGNKEMAGAHALELLTGLGYTLVGMILIVYYGAVSAVETAAVAAMLPFAVIGMFALLGAWGGERLWSHWKFGNELEKQIKLIERAPGESEGGHVWRSSQNFEDVKTWLREQFKNREYLEFQTSAAATWWADQPASTETKKALLHTLKELQKANRMHIFRDETHILIAGLAILAGVLMILTPPGAALAVSAIFIVTATLFFLGDSRRIDRIIRDTFFTPDPLKKAQSEPAVVRATIDSFRDPIPKL